MGYSYGHIGVVTGVLMPANARASAKAHDAQLVTEEPIFRVRHAKAYRRAPIDLEMGG